MRHFKTLALIATLAVSTLASAAPVTPTYGSFGAYAVPGDFGGNGIPTDAVAMSTLSDGTVMALSVTQRYFAAAPSNNGAGVFQVQGGVSGALPNYGYTNLALWNFDFYVAPGQGNLTYQLFVDTDPSVGNDLSSYLSIPVAGGNYATGGAPWTDSTNLGYFSSSFDPTAPGEYGFVLEAFDGDREVGSTSILVDVPEPASIALVGIALIGVAGVSRRRKA